MANGDAKRSHVRIAAAEVRRMVDQLLELADDLADDDLAPEAP